MTDTETVKEFPIFFSFTKNEQKDILKQQHSRLIIPERWKCTQQHGGRDRKMNNGDF